MKTRCVNWLLLTLVCVAGSSATSLARQAIGGPAAVAGGDVAAMLGQGTPAGTPLGELTALEKYVRADDGAFAWSLERSVRVEGKSPGFWHALRMTSQVWRKQGEVDVPAWTHWVNLWVPDVLVSDKPILFIGGGRRREQAPDGPPKELQMFGAAGALVIAVDNVPNQPLRLGDDPSEREEDGLVSRSWLRAMETGDPTWIARFPMVKAAVRAMDAFEAFAAKHPMDHAKLDGRALGADFKPGKYLVAGGSKRGWTTWLTAAVDARVGALAPLVIDVLDVPAQMKHHHEAYGFWAPALNDYVETGLTDRFATLKSDALLNAVLAHEDPINWLSRIGNKPKLLMNASGDEFFVSDSARYYVDRLPAPWRLRYVPNSGHSLKGTTAPADLIAFYATWATGATMPDLTWEYVAGTTESVATLSVHASVRPEHVRYWSVATKGPRDFRVEETGKTWVARDLIASDQAGLSYAAGLEAPAVGYAAAFIEASFPPVKAGMPGPVFTTRIYVLPDRAPAAAAK